MAGQEVEADVADRVQDVGAQVEVDREVADREHRLDGLLRRVDQRRPAVRLRAHQCSYGSAASRSPSPMKLKDSTASTTASDGQISSQGAVAMVRMFCASCSSTP